MPHLRAMATVVMMLLAAACVGGNSGAEGVTEPPKDPPNQPPGGDVLACPCDYWRAGAPMPPSALRVKVEAKTGDDRFSLRLEQVLAGPLALSPGALLDATWDGSLPCYEGCSDVSVGDRAFAFYFVDQALCPARADCIARCEADNEASGEQAWELRSQCSETWVRRGFETGRNCEPECEAAVPCAEADYRRGAVRLAAWTDPLVFASGDAAELRIALDDLDELWIAAGGEASSVTECIERFGDWTQVVTRHLP